MNTRTFVYYCGVLLVILSSASPRPLHARLIEQSEVEGLSKATERLGSDLQPLDGWLMESGRIYRFDHGRRTPLDKPASLRRQRQVAMSAGDERVRVAPMPLDQQLEVTLKGLIYSGGVLVWKMSDDEFLGADGAVIQPNGRVTYAEEHIIRREGKLYHVRSGVETPLSPGAILADGTLIADYGRVVLPNGSFTYLDDGQILRPAGGELQSWDSISLRNGVVMLYKDGSLLTIAREQKLMMSTGTLVCGDGRIIRRTKQSDWSEVTTQLKEGTVLKLEGAINEHRLFGGARRQE